jgi:hypothetical protein
MWTASVIATAAIAVTIAATPAPAPTGTRPLGQMSAPRAVHTATALRDGTVLIVGGCARAGCPLDGREGRVAEVYRPQTRQFVRVGRLHQWRDDHAATRLADGRVLVVGGWGVGGVLGTTELYDPRARTFSRGPTMASPRAGTTVTPLRDGRVLIAGGFTGNRPTTAGAEVFAPASNRLSALPQLNEPRGGHVAVRLSDGRVLIAGGLGNGRVSRSTEIFDPVTDTFRAAARMLAPRYKAAATLLDDGRVMILGGAADIDGRTVYSTTELYDPRDDRFVAGPSMRRARYKLTGSVVPFANGDVLVAGGADAVELYEAQSGRFRLAGRLDARRLFLAAARLPGRQALLAGGYDEQITPTRQAWLYR